MPVRSYLQLKFSIVILLLFIFKFFFLFHWKGNKQNISFSNACKLKVKVKSLSRVRLFATPWTAAYQAPPGNFTYLEANLDTCFSWCRDQQAQPQKMSYLSLCVGEGLLVFSMTSAFHGAHLGGASGKAPTCHSRRLKRHGFNSCVGMIP